MFGVQMSSMVELEVDFMTSNAPKTATAAFLDVFKVHKAIDGICRSMSKRANSRTFEVSYEYAAVRYLRMKNIGSRPKTCNRQDFVTRGG